MAERTTESRWTGVVRTLMSIAGAIVLTLLIFLVLPLMQAIGSGPSRDLTVRSVGIGNLPPPPPPVAEPEVEEEEPPPPPPKLLEQAPPLDLSQLELALNPGMGGGGFGDFEVDLSQVVAGDQGSESFDDVFSLADLDQKPRPIFQRAPTYPAELRRSERKGTVYVLFLVDRDGRVVNPRVQESTDPAFDRPALEAVRQWKFEPGTRKGEKVQFKMRIPISFNAG